MPRESKYNVDAAAREKYEADFFDKRVREQFGDPSELAIEKQTNREFNNIMRLLGVDVDALAGKKILDCGCGSGLLCTLFAMKGCRVCGIDVSSESVRVTRERARINGVGALVQAETMSLEKLSYQDEEFDMIVGMFVLHHVNVSAAGREILLILKPGGTALFSENSARNRVLIGTRRLLTGRLFVPKKSNDLEHPLTTGEVDVLRGIFGGQCRVSYPHFVFFELLHTYILRKRFKVILGLLTFLDRIVYRLFPFLRRYSYHQIILLKKI